MFLLIFAVQPLCWFYSFLFWTSGSPLLPSPFSFSASTFTIYRAIIFTSVISTATSAEAIRPAFRKQFRELLHALEIAPSPPPPHDLLDGTLELRSEAHPRTCGPKRLADFCVQNREQVRAVTALERATRRPF